jgi:hypothetical protein
MSKETPKDDPRERTDQRVADQFYRLANDIGQAASQARMLRARTASRSARWSSNVISVISCNDNSCDPVRRVERTGRSHGSS